MLYLITAMYAEAQPLIRQYQLKKENAQMHFQVFSNESQCVRLIITGTGMIAAAAAVGFLCTAYPPGEHDVLVNIGICAGAPMRDGLFLCSKITEMTTGKTFYPDLLYRHSLLEASIFTSAEPLRQEDLTESHKTMLYDMEASAVYQAGSYWFGPHQMCFLKTISDSGENRDITPMQVQIRMQDEMDAIVLFLDRLHAAGAKMQTKNHRLLKSADEIAERLCRDLCCSCVMAASVRQYIRYGMLSGTYDPNVIQSMYEEQKLPCRNKREGKRCFEELKKRLL